MRHIKNYKKFEGVLESEQQYIIDESVEKILEDLVKLNHEFKAVGKIANSMLTELNFGEVDGGDEMKLGELMPQIEREYVEEVDDDNWEKDIFLSAFATLNGGKTMVKVQLT
jgi:hypothetical protein